MSSDDRWTRALRGDADEVMATDAGGDATPALDVDVVLAENARLRADLADARREVAELRTLLTPVQEAVRKWRRPRTQPWERTPQVIEAREQRIVDAAIAATPEEKT